MLFNSHCEHFPCFAAAQVAKLQKTQRAAEQALDQYCYIPWGWHIVGWGWAYVVFMADPPFAKTPP